MRKTLAVLLAVSLVLVSGCGAEAPQGGQGTADENGGDEYAGVPDEYEEIYAELDKKLKEPDAYLDADQGGDRIEGTLPWPRTSSPATPTASGRPWTRPSWRS